MSKFLFATLIAFAGTVASAKILFDPQNRRAVVFQAHTDSIPVYVCEPVTDHDLQTVTLETTLKRSCRPISADGLTKASIGCNLAEFKTTALKKIDLMEQWMTSTLDQPGTDEASKTKFEKAKEAIAQVFAVPRKAIADAKPEDIYQIFEDEVRTPIVERVEKPEQLISEIEELVMLTRTQGSCAPPEVTPSRNSM